MSISLCLFYECENQAWNATAKNWKISVENTVLSARGGAYNIDRSVWKPQISIDTESITEIFRCFEIEFMFATQRSLLSPVCLRVLLTHWDSNLLTSHKSTQHCTITTLLSCPKVGFFRWITKISASKVVFPDNIQLFTSLNITSL